MDHTRSDRPRLLIAMIEAGGGHRAPALALQAALERRYPGRFDIDVLDIMRHTGDERLDDRHKASWRWMLAHPRITFALQTLIDRWLPVALTRWGQRRLLSAFSRHLAEFVRRGRYDLLLGVHFMPLQAAAMARRRGQLEATLIGFDTDPFDGHALWAVPEVDEMMVASEEAKALLAAKGVSEERLRVLGYPLGLPFVDAAAARAESAPPEAPTGVGSNPAEAARRRLGLDPAALTVLHTPGGEGIGGDVEGTVAAVLEADLDLQYVVIAGRNEGLRKRLHRLAEARAADSGRPPVTRLRVEGFTSAMADWIAAADLVLGKAGAASTFEALALGRPIFHTSYVAPNEKRNLDYCQAHGIGGYVPTPRAVVELLAPLTRDATPLRRWQAAVAALGFEPGTLAIADHVATLLEAE